MVDEVLRARSALRDASSQDPLPLEETPEYAAFQSAAARRGASDAAFRERVRRELGGRVSRLVDWKANNEEILAPSVREVLGLPRAALSDDDAIRLVLDPAKQPHPRRDADADDARTSSRARCSTRPTPSARSSRTRPTARTSATA